MTDYELLRAFIDQSGVACEDAEVKNLVFDGPGPARVGPPMRCVEFNGYKRGHKVDGHGRLEVLFEADGSLHDFCFWDGGTEDL